MSNSDSSEAEGEQIRVCLTLSPEVKDRSLQVTSEPIAVPATVGRKGLAAVINHLLDRKVEREKEGSDDDDSSDEDDDDNSKLPAIPFEFVLKDNNRLLRSGVEREARRYGLSLEKPLAIVYFPAQETPQLQGETETLPDWISCLSCTPHNLLCAAAYDGSLRIFQPQHQNDTVVLNPVVVNATAHKGPIKCMATTTKTTTTKGHANLLIATGSMDHTLVIHQLDTKKKELNQQILCQEGHACAIASLAFQSSTSILASGDWDGNLAVWNLPDATELEQPATKKPKTKTKSSTTSSIQSLTPQTVLPKAHNSQISGMSWGNHAATATASGTPSPPPHHHLVTGSWDHSIKLWDMERLETILSLNGSRVVACLDTSYHSEGIVATGHPDCVVRLWDVRQQPETATTSSSSSDNKTFRPSHKAWVSAVQWSPSNPYQLASTSHDGTLKVWDIRSSLPLHTVRVFPAKTEKGLCLAYNNNNRQEEGSFFVGGTDCIVKHLSAASYQPEKQ